MDEPHPCLRSCGGPPFLLNQGDRVRVQTTDDGDWKFGTLAHCEYEDYRVHLETGKIIESIKLQDASNIEKVMCKECWARTLFPEFCQDIKDGFLFFVELKRPARYREIAFQLCNDFMAEDLGNALRHSSGVEQIMLKGRELDALSLQGVGALARGIADNSTSLKKVSLFHFYNDEKADCFLRNLASSQTLEHLELFRCSFPGPDAFRHLCRSSLTKLLLQACSVTEASRAELEQYFSQFVSLRSVVIWMCPSDLIQSCLMGLSTHPLLEAFKVIRPTVLFTTISQQPLYHAFESFVTSQAQRDTLKSLKLSSDCGIDFDTFFDAVMRLESLECLDLDTFQAGIAEAIRIRSFLQTTTRLQKLFLPSLNDPKGLFPICEGMCRNQTLVELQATLLNFEPLLSALRGNTTLRTLNLKHDPSNSRHATTNFEGLRSVAGLRRLVIRNLHGWEIDFPSLVRGLQENPWLVELESVYLAPSLDTQDKIESYLQRNRWFQQYGAQLLQSPDQVARGIWPYALAKVSSNLTALYAMVNGYPGMAERKNSGSRKRRIDEII